MLKKYVWAGLFCLAAGTVCAQEIHDEIHREIDEVVVTGTGTEHLLRQSPVPVEVVSERDLKRVNLPSFENAMEALVPSLSFSPNAMGSFMQLNGLNNRYILVMVDGKRLYGDVSGNVDLARINMNNIRRIEIVKGASSSLYGSEAIAGVINIITQERKEPVYVTSDTRYSRYGQFDQAVSVDINQGGFSSATAYRRSQSDGWQLHSQEETKDGLADTYKKAVNRFYSDVLTQRFKYDTQKAMSLYVQGELFDKKFIRDPQYKYDMRYQDYNLGGGIKYELGAGSVVNLDFYTDNFEYFKDYTQASGSFEVGDEEKVRRQRYYDTHLKGEFRAGNWNRIVAGAQWQLDYLNSNGDIQGGSRDVYTLSFYAQDEMSLLDGKIQLVPGVRYVYHETFGSRLTPKLSAMYLSGRFTFRGTYAAGYKAPELKYLYSNTESTGASSYIDLANTKLKPESSDYFSLQAEYHWSPLSVSVSGYHNRVEDIITRYTFPEVPAEYEGQFDKVYQYRNSSKARVNGVDVSVSGYLPAGFSYGLGYSYVDTKDYDTDKPLEKISRHTGTAYVNWYKSWWVFRSNFNLNGRVQSK
ncbi:MAG: TonB-dependent receptor, partial [Rikenellaceae bacterium]|nr:TonB-dependent receptor [Rikenellaceae bacterium]